ncbi:hypothetical protein ACOMHN_054607 [Nucella lapillus]
MSQNSLLEVLSVTNNAVKALEKTSSSKSSGSEWGTPRSGVSGTGKDNAENHPPLYSQEAHDNSRSSADSGVGKTATQSNQAKSIWENLPALHESDDSTTASDVLVRSTLVEPNPTDHTGLNSSASSQGSRCKDLDNFNVADARKVKVSKKQLREIVSPREAHNISRLKQLETNLNFNNNQASHYKPENGKIINGSFPGKDLHSTKVRDTGNDEDRVSKMLTEHKKSSTGLSQGMDHGGVAYTVERHDGNPKQQPSDKPGAAAGMEKPKSASQQLSHFPYKVSRQGGATKEQVLMEQEDCAEDWDDQSITSSQPEIVTVEERIVNISSQALMMSDYEDSASQGSAVDVISAANRPQSFPDPRPKSKLQGGAGLKQGALLQGSAVQKTGKGDEVQISKFALTEKQRELREALSKRGGQSKAVKRVVQPRMVQDHLNRNNNMDTGDGGGTGGGGGGGRGGTSNMESITAAVAASAAVAATQPFLKMQQDLEKKMQSLLGEMDRVQKQAGGGGTEEPRSQQGGNPRLEHLEHQVKELTERRLQHLETLQSQQMQLQAQLLSMSQGMSQQQQQQQQQQQSTSHHPTYFPTSIAPHATAPQYNRALIERELMRGRLQGEDRRQDHHQHWGSDPVKPSEMVESALDTPNPRSRPPRPSQFNGGKGGLLQEILAAEPSPQLNTTFNLPPGDGASNARSTYRSSFGL